MSSDTILPGTLWRETEFVGGLTGACGPNALGFCASWSVQRHISTVDVYNTMRASPALCDANGVSNIGELRQGAQRLGLPLLDTRWYAEPWPDWSTWFDFHVTRGRAVLFEVANGQALVDSISGKGENAKNLKYHFLATFGRHPGGYSEKAGRTLPAGYWCADGDNFASGDVLQFYPDTVLSAAQPCAALAIGSEVKPMATYTQIKGPDGSTWYHCAETGKVIGGGIYRAYVQTHGYPACTMSEHPAPGRWSKSAIAGFGDPTGKTAQDALVFWDSTHGAVTAWNVHIALAYEAEIADLTKQLTDAKAATHPNTPTPQPATPAEPSKADELVAAIKAALAA